MKIVMMMVPRAIHDVPGRIPARERMNRREEKAHEHREMAAHHQGKAAGLRDQLDRTIFSDDEDAIETALMMTPSFRLVHVHGRALHFTLPRAVDDLDDYEWIRESNIYGGLTPGSYYVHVGNKFFRRSRPFVALVELMLLAVLVAVTIAIVVDRLIDDDKDHPTDS